MPAPDPVVFMSLQRQIAPSLRCFVAFRHIFCGYRQAWARGQGGDLTQKNLGGGLCWVCFCVGCLMGGKGLPVVTQVGNVLGSPALWGLLGGLWGWLPTWGSPMGSPVPVPVG